jgi:hypothetical protein
MIKKNYLIFFLFFSNIQAISLVYNLKLRRTFPDLHDILKKKDSPIWIATSVPIAYTRDRTINNTFFGINAQENRWLVGSLFNIRVSPRRSWWLELTTGLEHEKARSRGTPNFTVSRTGLDDIVLSGGYNLFFSKKWQAVVFGLVGAPTTRKISPFEAQDTLVGTRFYGAGIGSEISYAFMQNLKHGLLMFLQNRFLHFFDRKFQPILPADAKIKPGNVTDILLALRYRYLKNNIEVGFNPTFFTNQALVFPAHSIESKAFVRHSFFMRLNHISPKLPFFEKPGQLGTGFLISRAKKFNTKIASWWVSGSVVF